MQMSTSAANDKQIERAGLSDSNKFVSRREVKKIYPEKKHN